MVKRSLIDNSNTENPNDLTLLMAKLNEEYLESHEIVLLHKSKSKANPCSKMQPALWMRIQFLRLYYIQNKMTQL